MTLNQTKAVACNHLIKKFDKFGHFITKIGSYGKAPGQIIDPEHLAIDSDGDIYLQIKVEVNMVEYS